MLLIWNWVHACTGVLAVVRSNLAQDRPYTGLTELKSGEVAEDLASYLADSEQAGPFPFLCPEGSSGLPLCYGTCNTGCSLVKSWVLPS